MFDFRKHWLHKIVLNLHVYALHSLKHIHSIQRGIKIIPIPYAFQPPPSKLPSLPHMYMHLNPTHLANQIKHHKCISIVRCLKVGQKHYSNTQLHIYYWRHFFQIHVTIYISPFLLPKRITRCIPYCRSWLYPRYSILWPFIFFLKL